MRELDKEAMFPKDNIAGDIKTMKDRIITPIQLLSFSIANKATKPRPKLKFVILIQLKKNKIGRAKEAKVVILWR